MIVKLVTSNGESGILLRKKAQVARLLDAHQLLRACPYVTQINQVGLSKGFTVVSFKNTFLSCFTKLYKLPEHLSKKYFYQACTAVLCCHNNVFDLTLSPGNIFLSHSGDLTIGSLINTSQYSYKAKKRDCKALAAFFRQLCVLSSYECYKIIDILENRKDIGAVLKHEWFATE
jgi:hypothetical protein